MKDMKLTKTESNNDSPLAEDDRKYPYGLSLSLDEDALKKLGITELPAVGKSLTLHAKVKVESVSESEYESGASKNLGLQITHMELDAGKSREEQANKIYKE